jgi:hypothetical protein
MPPYGASGWAEIRAGFLKTPERLIHGIPVANRPENLKCGIIHGASLGSIDLTTSLAHGVAIGCAQENTSHRGGIWVWAFANWSGRG